MGDVRARHQDVRYGVRLMAHSRAFTAMVVLSLALGIGAVSTVFALINAIEIRTLPVARPDELVWLKDPSFSYPVFREIRDRGGMFAPACLRGTCAPSPCAGTASRNR